MSCCPVCGSAFDHDGIIVIRDRGLIVRGNRAATPTPSEFEVFCALLDARPRVLTKQNILARLYLLDADEAAIKIVDVFICKLRKHLAPLAVTIETHQARGYSLRFEGALRDVVAEAA